jgi:basic amino acid/polyamine antiporter, APA family
MSNSPRLNRSLGLSMAIFLVIANIIGSGVYKKVAPMAAELHSAGWVLTCWILGGIVSLFGALSNAEIASMLADTGGEYTYYKVIYGRFFSYLYGWSNFAAIKTATIASLAYVFAQSFNSLIPLPVILPSWSKICVLGIFYPFESFQIKLLVIGMILFLTWFNTTGVKTGAGLSRGIILLVLAGLLVISVFGLTSSHAVLSAPFQWKVVDGSQVTISAVFTAMLAAFWAYEGWNSVGFLGGEIKNPQRNVPVSITIGLLIVIAVYLLINTTYLTLLPVPDLVKLQASGHSIAAIAAVQVFWGKGGMLFISTLILVTTLGCIHTTILSNSRTYYAMAREGVFFRGTEKVNKAQAPASALWFQGIWACVLVLSGSFDQLTDMLIFAAFIYYGATTLGVFILRKKMPDAPRPYKVWGYPVVPALFILFCLFLIVNTIVTRPREAAIGLTLILLGIPFYLRFNRRSFAGRQ